MRRAPPSAEATLAPLLTPAEVAGLLRQGQSPVAQATTPPPPPLAGRVGERSGRRTGSGLDYAGTRGYQGGDDPRHVHWRATARSGRLQVRQFHPDIQPLVCCLVDRGASMRFGTRRRLKATQAARLALLLSARELRQGEELAALVLEPQGHWLPPAVGAAALQRLARRVAAPAPPIAAGPAAGPADWQAALAELALRLAPGATLILISDFRGLSAAHAALLAAAGRRFEARAFVVGDAAERELPPVGPLALHWGGAVRETDGRDPVARARHAAAWRTHATDLRDLFARAVIPCRFVDGAAEDLTATLAGTADGD